MLVEQPPVHTILYTDCAARRIAGRVNHIMIWFRLHGVTLADPVIITIGSGAMTF